MKSIACFVERAIQIWSRVSQDSKMSKLYDQPIFFVMCDHDYACEEALASMSRKGYHGFDADKYASSIKHIGLKVRKNKDQTRTFLDFFFFSKMDSAIITFSGFSTTSVRFNCVPTLMYFQEKENENKCQNFFDFTEHGLCHPEWINY